MRSPSFALVLRADVRELVEADGRVRGVRYRNPDGWHEVRALLTVGADGRFSRVRQRAGLWAGDYALARRLLEEALAALGWAALALRRNATAPPAAMILHARGPVQAARGRAAGAPGGVAARAVLECAELARRWSTPCS